ncbi:MAG: PD-(D/E)XK nuclease family protein [Candidatus Pacearchaeota archaeon]
MQSKPKYVWNPTNIDEATYCPYKYFLIHFMGIQKPVTGDMAKGIIMHKAAEYLYKKDKQTKLYQIRFRSAEDFANVIAGKKNEEGRGRKGGWWNFIVANGTIQGKQIKWKNEAEPWIIREEIWQMCYKMYERLSKEPAPIHIEYKIPIFEINGHFFNGRIDSILYGPKIRDIKSGHRVPGDMKLKYDPQFTLYALALGCLCNKDKEFAKSIGVSEEEAKQWGGNPIYLSDKIALEYLLIMKDEIYPMKRNDINFYDFMEMIKGMEQQFESGNVFPERGRLCDHCEISQKCDELTKKLSGRTAREYQIKLFGDSVPREENKIVAIQRTLYSKTNIRKTQEMNNDKERAPSQ